MERSDVPVMKHESEPTTLTISLSSEQRDLVEAQAAASGCASATEYMRRLIHEAQKRAARDELERHLIAGLESGAPIAITPEYWERKRRALVERHRQKKL